MSLEDATVTLMSSTFNGNKALGRNGGTGGNGRAGAYVHTVTFGTSTPTSVRVSTW